jgi:hypothetical protein
MERRLARVEKSKEKYQARYQRAHWALNGLLSLAARDNFGGSPPAWLENLLHQQGEDKLSADEESDDEPKEKLEEVETEMKEEEAEEA